MSIRKIAIISTGNGGQSMAAYLAARGYQISLYARQQERVDSFGDGTFHVQGILDQVVHIDLISCHMDQVIQGADMILVTTPAQYHKHVAQAMAPYLTDGQMIILNPGRTFGSAEFENTLQKCGCKADIMLGETDTFLFTCRCNTVGNPHIYFVKNEVQLAAVCPQNSAPMAAAMGQVFGANVVPEDSILYTGLTNIGMIFHPTPTLMNITRLEKGESFRHYKDGITPLVASVLEQLDAERVAVAKAAGITVPTVFDWLNITYSSTGDTLYHRIQNTNAYSDVYAPTTTNTRYVLEDVPTGCVPVASLGQYLGVDTPVINAIIDWSSTLYRTDFRATGRNQTNIDFGKLLK